MASLDQFVEDEMRERAAHMLRHTLLFANVSSRLLSDLVEKVGVTQLEGPPYCAAESQIVVLIVLGGVVELRKDPGAPLALLEVGTYFLSDTQLHDAEVAGWENVRMVPRDLSATYVFMVRRDDFLQLPRVIVNALDPTELGNLIVFL